MTVPCLAPAVRAPTAAAAAGTLRARGLRLSTPRRLLLAALFAADRPLSAEELAADGDVASTYRNLDVLERLGVVRHVHLGHGPSLYQPTGAHGEFVLCERCGALDALAPGAIERVRVAVRAATGYAARFSHTPLAGLCPDCQDD